MTGAMTEADLSARLGDALADLELDPDVVDALGGQLLWRIGRVSDDAPVTVRIGFATSARHFAELPRLRSASDEELSAAVAEGSLRVEWVGHRPG